jgi:hypothetical protein
LICNGLFSIIGFCGIFESQPMALWICDIQVIAAPTEALCCGSSHIQSKGQR